MTKNKQKKLFFPRSIIYVSTYLVLRYLLNSSLISLINLIWLVVSGILSTNSSVFYLSVSNISLHSCFPFRLLIIFVPSPWALSGHNSWRSSVWSSENLDLIPWYSFSSSFIAYSTKWVCEIFTADTVTHEKKAKKAYQNPNCLVNRPVVANLKCPFSVLYWTLVAKFYTHYSK